MAAYATLVSLMHLIENIQLYHADHPTFLNEHQKQLESLHKKVTNLQDLLEWFSHKGFNEAHDLESRIADAAIGAEDIIELYIVGDIHGRSWKELTMLSPDNFINVHKMDAIFFSEELQKVIECMDLMGKEMMKIKEKSVFEDQQQLPDLQPTGSQQSPLDGNNDMVGFQYEFNEIMNKLTGHGSNLKFISIIGMGGIGKSTLARSVCDNRSTMNYFDVRGWIVISQEFNVKRRMFDLLKEIEVLDDEYDEKKHDYHELGEKLHKHLSGRRFLIIVDDIWSVNDWVKLKLFLPDNNNGSRIILTTRLLNVAKDVGSSNIYKMNFLDENTSWSLLCKKVFLNEPCPLKLLEVGKKIAKNCKGLPLSLSVIGGLLAKLEKTRKCWENIARDINMIVTAEEDERYLKILALSYSHLPIYLKPCFLYMGIFPEDHSMDVGLLIDLWIAEGFLKPRGASKSLEEVAQNYLEDLIERSLIYVSKTGNTGDMESIRIHDLLRDLALREAQKEKFLHVTTLHDHNISIIINSERRVGLLDSASYNRESECENALSAATSLRSLIFDTRTILSVSPGMRSLRISKDVHFLYSSKDIFHLINSRYLKIFGLQSFPLSSMQLLWNLQIIFINSLQILEMPDTFPIWEMPLLRKLDMLGVTFPDPPGGRMEGKGDLVLTNLQKIESIKDFRCTDVVLRKFSNIKELSLIYYNEHGEALSHYCLNNLGRLHTLQNLEIWNLGNVEWLTRTDFLQNIGFSQSLKKLLLQKCGFEWEHLTTKVGSLPHLEELTLNNCYSGEEWILVEEGAFLCLKVLKITTCCGLVRWSAESIHFPCLEHLFLEKMESLEEIPFDIGDIATLQSIQLNDCSRFIVDSAKLILKEQRSFENYSLRILVNQKHLQEEDEVEEVEEGGVNQKHIQEENKKEEVEESGGGEGGEEDHEEEEKEVHGEKEQEKKRSKGFVAFVVPFMVILGFSYVLVRNKFGGRGKRRGESMDKQKEDNDRRGREAEDNSWFSFYDNP